ncbi:RNA 2',3'-cyclic phosphodiesterase [Desulfopila sp. IMCC35006]|uniref:RNA 2',3'-cyclic phosphodiesterase n=1 Tax=Desulfopila sp. IMCC35006 TaxID=2569542 RepID=UPI0010AC804E|nr:RNA 2',3'-cyclic phosphodiesterase [Desulfopila sp. IMCC35006]TKB26967.1 RNA 2',3'-cyclic phosphodiesterase [Desulfopila sp. IMCC35006]
MIRLFIAIDIAETVRREVEGMGRSIPNARAVPTDQLHLTLKFIGEVDGARFLDIQEALQDIRGPRFVLALKGVGIFAPRDIPRILWAGIEPVQPVVTLRNAIERTLAAIEVPRDRKKFTPHLTLARLNHCSVTRLHQFLAGNAFFQSSEFAIDSFHLYSSKLTQKGAQHTLESSYQLD